MEWIRKVLKAQGLEEAVIDKIIEAMKKPLGENFVIRADFNDKIKEVKALNETLANTNNALEEVKKTVGKEDETLLATIETLKTTIATDKENFTKEQEKQKYEFALVNELTAANPHNVKALRALLDESKITYDIASDKMIGLTEQVTALKESDKYVFKEFSKGFPSANPGANEFMAIDFGKLTSEQRVKFKELNPTLYNEKRIAHLEKTR